MNSTTANSSGAVRRTALILVDIQPTFCEGGELAVAGGNQVATDTATYLNENASSYDTIVTTQDWHIDPGHHFSGDPDFVDTWPVHGLAGSPNAEVHPEVRAALDKAGVPVTVVRKGAYEAAYSGFEGVNENDETLVDLLRAAGITDVDVCGIAQSHCVKATVLDAITSGFTTRLLTDLTVPVSEELGAAATVEMREAGTIEVAANQRSIELNTPSAALA